ncbi:hypothetical protein COL922a_010529 [Colletotrichum nupharicola]|nr:hypothetical protein COL922a_010529 [Colletotrichum nupharicola]
MSAEGNYTQLSNVANDDDIDPEHVKIYMMTKLTEEEEQKYLKSIDGTSVEEEGTILVDRAWYALCTSKKASEQISKLARDNGIEMTAEQWMSMPGYAEDLMDLALERGIVWGREVGAQWKSDWMNLDVSNMDTGELLEDEFEIVLDPEWDAASFLERLREELEKRKEQEES